MPWAACLQLTVLGKSQREADSKIGSSPDPHPGPQKVLYFSWVAGDVIN